MPHFNYRLGRIFIRPYRNRYTWAVYGATAEGQVRYHSRLMTFRALSRDSARATVERLIQNRRYYVGLVNVIGHHAGATRCYMGCDDGAEYFDLLPPLEGTDTSPPQWGPARVVSRFAGLPTFPREPPMGNIAPGLVSIGVELEGEMSDRNAVDRLERWASTHCPRMGDNHQESTIQGDGSVETFNDGSAVELTFWSTNLQEIEQWLDLMYGEFGVVPNQTCGFHIHVKPVEGYAMAFTTRGYWEGFHDAYADFSSSRASKYGERPDSTWCRIRPWDARFVSNAMRGEASDRYRAINLLSYEGHDGGGFRTIEHRIMPYQSSAVEAKLSVKWMVDTVSKLITNPLVALSERIPTPTEMPEMVTESVRDLSEGLSVNSSVAVPEANTVWPHMPVRDGSEFSVSLSLSQQV